MSATRSRIEAIGQDWPVYARLLGAFIGVAEMAASFVGLPVSTPVLGFAGGLLLAPRIAGRSGPNAKRKTDAVRDLAVDLLSTDEREEEDQ